MFERLKRLFAPKEPATDERTVESPVGPAPDLPVGGMIAGVPPVVPPERRADEPDEPQS